MYQCRDERCIDLKRRDLLIVERAHLVGDDDVRPAVAIDVLDFEVRPYPGGLLEIDVVAVPDSTPVEPELVINEHSGLARPLAAGAVRPFALAGDALLDAVAIEVLEARGVALGESRGQGLGIHLVLQPAAVLELLDPPPTAVVRPSAEDAHAAARADLELE